MTDAGPVAFEVCLAASDRPWRPDGPRGVGMIPSVVSHGASEGRAPHVEWGSGCAPCSAEYTPTS